MKSGNLEYRVENVINDTHQREALVEFLAGFEDEKDSRETWNARLHFWWEGNPMYQEELPRGWILRHQDQIVGFFGVIISEYTYQGEIFKAFNATTWRVEKKHRSQSALLLLEFLSYKKSYIMFDTTPIDIVEKMLNKFKFRYNSKLNNYILPVKSRIKFHPRNLYQKLVFHRLPEMLCRPVAADENFHFLGEEGSPSSTIQKRRNTSILRWYSFMSKFEKELIGRTDSNGRLTAYLILSRQRYKGYSMLRVIDYYSNDPEGREIAGMLRYICGHPLEFPIVMGSRFLVFSDYSLNRYIGKALCGCPNLRLESKFYLDMQGFWRRNKLVSFLVRLYQKFNSKCYYSLPDSMREAEVINYMAEGDFLC